VAYNYETNLIN